MGFMFTEEEGNRVLLTQEATLRRMIETHGKWGIDPADQGPYHRAGVAVLRGWGKDGRAVVELNGEFWSPDGGTGLETPPPL